MTHPTEQLTTVKELSSILQVTERTIYSLIKKNQIPFSRLGNTGDYRFDTSSVLKSLDRTRNNMK